MKAQVNTCDLSDNFIVKVLFVSRLCV